MLHPASARHNSKQVQPLKMENDTRVSLSFLCGPLALCGEPSDYGAVLVGRVPWFPYNDEVPLT